MFEHQIREGGPDFSYPVFKEEVKRRIQLNFSDNFIFHPDTFEYGSSQVLPLSEAKDLVQSR
jgi:hypothetical protein